MRKILHPSTPNGCNEAWYRLRYGLAILNFIEGECTNIVSAQRNLNVVGVKRSDIVEKLWWVRKELHGSARLEAGLGTRLCKAERFGI